MTFVPTDEFWTWVKKHQDHDINKLRLAYHNKMPWIEEAINQIENTRISKKKFNTPEYRHLLPSFLPIKLSVEQCTSPNVANLHYQLSGLSAKTTANVLDMTCGLGIDTSFLGCNPNVNVIAVERDSKIASVADFNYSSRTNITILNQDSIEFLKDTAVNFDLIFIDPARRNSSGGRVYNLHDCTPDVTDILNLLKSKSDRIMIKMSPMLDISQTIKDLPGVNELHVIEERGECRELLAIISTENPNLIQPIICAWNNGTKLISFNQSEEAAAEVRIGTPKNGDILYEPNASIMKAAPFKLLTDKYNISKLHHNTHLYVSDHLIEMFPGMPYRIDEILPFSSSNIKSLKRRKLNAEVATRNFPITAEQLKSRIGIRHSGSSRIMGATLFDNKPYLLMLSPIN